jgi:predicted enzyme related to lactoylglutathione lyase
MEMLEHAVNWVEIPVVDFDRAKKFYSTIYDYEMPEMMMGPNRMGFLLFKQEGGVGAAIVKGEGYTPVKNGAKVYLNGGADLNIVLNRISKAGGKVILEKTVVAPGLGHFAIFEDSEGNILSLHSAN